VLVVEMTDWPSLATDAPADIEGEARSSCR